MSSSWLRRGERREEKRKRREGRSNSSLQTFYACKLQLRKTVLDGATCLISGEKDSTVAHRGSVTPSTKRFILVKFDR